MAKPFNPIPDYRPKTENKVKDEGLPLKPCLICNKMCQAYGAWLVGQTCSRACELVQENAPRCFGE